MIKISEIIEAIKLSFIEKIPKYSTTEATYKCVKTDDEKYELVIRLPGEVAVVDLSGLFFISYSLRTFHSFWISKISRNMISGCWYIVCKFDPTSIDMEDK